MAKRKNRDGFPSVVFLHWEGEGEDRYLVVDESPEAEEIEDGDRAAVYELREVRTKRVTHALE